jgi:hypothetical protein
MYLSQANQLSAITLEQIKEEITDYEAKLESAKQRRTALLEGSGQPRSFSRSERGSRETLEMAILEIGGYIAKIELKLRQAYALQAQLQSKR